MTSKCATCSKTVYPVETLRALDQVFHKGCFRCDVCNIKLTMKTYKGYNKRPYCNTHYPTTKFTAVADTPENLRIKKNTAQQSSIQYTKDIQNLKGTKLSVADDPETQRIKKNTDNQSGVKYHNLAGQREQENVRREQEAENLVGTNRQVRVGPPEAPRQVGSLFEPEDHHVPNPPSSGPSYVAIYDYTAAADDEVSFNEGDIIIDGEVIDDGWMTGTVQRTGQSGMLPSNYVEPC